MSLPLPSTLSPSKINKFVSCPLAFRYSYIDHLPEPSTIHQVRGTLVHRALQILFSDADGADRTPERALDSLEAAWVELTADEELTGLGLDDDELARLRREATSLVERYFLLEDPTRVRPIGLELDLRARLGDIELRGIIDRLDLLPNGELAIVDYKTGRAPRADHARGSLAGVQFYAFMCEALFGKRPSEVRLVYVKDQVVLVESPTEQGMRGLRQRVTAVWKAIERACSTGDFRPNPSPLCKSCAFSSRCPAFASAAVGQLASA